MCACKKWRNWAIASAIGTENATTGVPQARISSTLAGRRLSEPALGLLDQVSDHRIDHPTEGLVHQPRRLHIRVQTGYRANARPHQGQIAQIVEQEHAGPEAVVQIVTDIGDVVGVCCDLRLGARIALQPEIVIGRIGRDIGRRSIADQRAVVLDHALERLPGKVQAVETRRSGARDG